MTESAQPHISTSVWRCLFLYIHQTEPVHPSEAMFQGEHCCCWLPKRAPKSNVLPGRRPEAITVASYCNPFTLHTLKCQEGVVPFSAAPASVWVITEYVAALLATAAYPVSHTQAIHCHTTSYEYLFYTQSTHSRPHTSHSTCTYVHVRRHNGHTTHHTCTHAHTHTTHHTPDPNVTTQATTTQYMALTSW